MLIAKQVLRLLVVGVSAIATATMMGAASPRTACASGELCGLDGNTDCTEICTPPYCTGADRMWVGSE
ncbi:MAG TPA: hypothetical protein VHE78_16485 [Gemmatimonadaceae bacterium]|nr:hypothetical protein [Gemmatimonadaceae bacterium]